MPESVERLKAALADRYRIERELGAGGMAIVYRATDLKHERQVAVKVLAPDLAAEIGHERFLREIRTTANLRHPHILPLYDSGEAAGSLYYVMPYVEGESLRDRLEREKQLPLDDALRIAREVGDALSYAHSQGVVHRDIKPENILLESGHAVVADFGIARAVSVAAETHLTKTGTAVGTPLYMSPEQAAGERELDGRSDLYSLGCVLYEMLAGRPPFVGPTAQSIVGQHIAAEPPSVTTLRPAVPAEIAGALQRALAKTPADRYNPVALFTEALTVTPRAASAAAPSGRRRALFASLVAIALIAVVATLLLRPSGETATPTIGKTIQVTREPGLEVDPALSPDGQMVAFAAGPPTGMRIFVRAVSGGRTVALTEDGAGNCRWPRWSPDGKLIAYESADGIYVVPPLGGPSRLVVRSPEAARALVEGMFAPISGLTWSPDGRKIAFSGSVAAEGLHIVDAGGGEPSRLAAPREAHSPAWSPDGTRIAVVSGNAIFVFGSTYFGNVGSSSIWVVPVNGGDPVRVTEDDHLDGSPTWSPDGRYLYWVSDRGGGRDVYRIHLNDEGAPAGEPVRLTTGSSAQTISLSADGRHLAYASLRTPSNIWSIPVPATGPVSIAVAQPVTAGSQTIEDVDVTADGEWLVFDSDRDGNPDIYKLRIGTQEPIQLTTDSAGDFAAAWSPDARRIAFHSLRSGNRDLFTMEADGTGLRQVTRSPAHELDADWSPDGRSLVAEIIDPEGVAEQSFIIVPLGEGESAARRLPALGDFAVWSPAGDLIAYHASDGLRVIAPDGGASRLLVPNEPDISEPYYAAWSPDGATLYYLARGPDGWMIRGLSEDGGPARILVRFDDPTRQQTRYGFATDGRTFYFTMGSPESDVWVLEFDGS